jgi:uncharacterized membrane protein
MEIEQFEAPGGMVSSAVVADNLMMAIYFIVLMMIPAMSFFEIALTHLMWKKWRAEE